jgi:hypothetical protein
MKQKNNQNLAERAKKIKIQVLNAQKFQNLRKKPQNFVWSGMKKLLQFNFNWFIWTLFVISAAESSKKITLNLRKKIYTSMKVSQKLKFSKIGST